MKLSNGNGAARQNSPVKTLSKHATDFIASCAVFIEKNRKLAYFFGLISLGHFILGAPK